MLARSTNGDVWSGLRTSMNDAAADRWTLSRAAWEAFWVAGELGEVRQMRASVHRGKGAVIEPLRWSDTLAVGHQELDDEHRLMVELIS